MTLDMDKLVCVKDFEEAALKLLDRNAFNFYTTGVDDEVTVKENKEAFKRWMIRPRVLVDVSKRSISTTVLGKPVAFPLGVAPTGMQKLAHPDGECATAKAAASMDTIFVLSTVATSSIEDVAAAAPLGRKWFQLYVNEDREISEGMVKRAEQCGYEAIVLTVDAQLLGRRRANLREGTVTLPPHINYANFSDGSSKLQLPKVNHFDETLSWEDVKWLRRITKLPIIVKGILVPEDAEMAIEYGVDAIIVSNHGGRQLDTVSSSIDTLPGIVERVAGRCEVYVDGGVTTGTDVYKAIALGAKMVFAGRPLLWGLAVGGEKGARKVLQIYKEEFDLAMALTGTPNVGSITRERVTRFPTLARL